MASTSKSAWKQRERQAAALFGAKRQRCSGSSGREDCSRSDSTHDRLFVETKLRASNAVRTLYDGTAELARRERKTPVLLIADKGRPGFLVVMASTDLPVILAEYAAANASDGLEGAIRRAYLRHRGELEEDDEEALRDPETLKEPASGSPAWRAGDGMGDPPPPPA